MSSFNFQSTFQSSSYASYTDSSGNKYEKKVHSNPTGTTTQRSTQRSGQPLVTESSHVPTQGHTAAAGGEQRVIEDVTDQEETEAKQQEGAVGKPTKGEGKP